MKFKIRLVNEAEELEAWQCVNERDLPAALQQIADAPHCLRPGDRYTIERVDAEVPAPRPFPPLEEIDLYGHGEQS